MAGGLPSSSPSQLRAFARARGCWRRGQMALPTGGLAVEGCGVSGRD